MIKQTPEQIKEAKEQARAEYIVRVQDQITFGHDGRGDIAWLPFSDNDGEFYTCTFENGKAKKCTCPDCWNRKSYCKHLEALDCFLYIQSLKTIFPEKEEPVVESTADQIAAVAEEVNMKKMAEYRRHTAQNAYEVLAMTKNVQSQPKRQMSDIEAKLTRRGLMKQ